MRQLLITGYGAPGQPSAALYEERGGLWQAVWQEEGGSPSYACMAGDLLITGQEQPVGCALGVYRRRADGFCLLERMPAPGGGLCHLAWNPRDRVLYGSCYETGHILSVEISPEGQVLRLDALAPSGNGASRTHCCALSPDGRYVYGVNIARDRVYCYRAVPGGLEPADAVLQLPEGEGPRHLCFHPTLPAACLITEYSNRIWMLGYDAGTGALSAEECVSSLPEGFTGESYGSGILFSPDGKRLYAGNRGADSVAVFAVEGLRLQKVQDAPCGGSWPRSLALGNGVLLCANQRAGRVNGLRLDGDGRIAGEAFAIPFAQPSYVQELPPLE